MATATNVTTMTRTPVQYAAELHEAAARDLFYANQLRGKEGAQTWGQLDTATRARYLHIVGLAANMDPRPFLDFPSRHRVAAVGRMEAYLGRILENAELATIDHFEGGMDEVQTRQTIHELKKNYSVRGLAQALHDILIETYQEAK